MSDKIQVSEWAVHFFIEIFVLARMYFDGAGSHQSEDYALFFSLFNNTQRLLLEVFDYSFLQEVSTGANDTEHLKPCLVMSMVNISAWNVIIISDFSRSVTTRLKQHNQRLCIHSVLQYF